MKTATIITIATIQEADRSIPKAKREKVMDVLLDSSTPPITQEKELINTRQAAEIIGIHPVTLRNLAQKDTIPVIRFSARKLRYDQAAIEAYAQGQGVNQ
ncbi:helix-turn-helix domain-containing protein [Pontiellaceae bacterium B12227]|nr:helix-turn-helix domain-containing protein [Pontiellaceae bacterium B12227]